MLHRASESEAQRMQRLAAGQQCEADRSASESEAQRYNTLLLVSNVKLIV